MITLIKTNTQSGYITFEAVTDTQVLETLLNNPHIFIETHTGKLKLKKASYFVAHSEIDNLPLILDCFSSMCTVESVTLIDGQGEESKSNLSSVLDSHATV